MTNHRSSTDAQFDTHLGTLTESTLDAKITAWEALQADLGVEKTEVEGHRTQVFKHRKKVTDMLADLDTLKSYASAVQGEVTQAELDAVIASVAALQPPTPLVYSGLNDSDDIPISKTDRFVILKHDQVEGLICTLPADATTGTTIFIKNMQTSSSPVQGWGVGVGQSLKIRPAQGQTPIHTIDYRFTHLLLDPSASTGDEMTTQNETCRLVFISGTSPTWLNSLDSY